MTEFADRYGPWAVVTGAAAGVGLAFVEELAARGLGVVMVDIAPGVVDVAADIAERADPTAGRDGGPVGATRPLVADVGDPAWLGELASAVDDLEVGLAVANAGVSHIGPYLDMDATQRRRILDVNCAATADLASWALPPMVERGRGGLLVTSSGSALAGTGGVGLYSATKAFAVNLVEAIGWELRDTGVDALAIVAPTMDTPAFRSSSADPSRMLTRPVDPRRVVSGALDALPRGGRWLADTGLEFAAALDRAERVEMISAATTRMYPDVFGGRDERPGTDPA